MAHVHTSHFSQSPSLDVGHYQPQTNTTLSAVVTAENAIKECTAFKKNLLVLIVHMGFDLYSHLLLNFRQFNLEKKMGQNSNLKEG